MHCLDRSKRLRDRNGIRTETCFGSLFFLSDVVLVVFDGQVSSDIAPSSSRLVECVFLDGLIIRAVGANNNRQML